MSNHQEARLNNERADHQKQLEALEKQEEDLSAQVNGTVKTSV